MSLTVFLFFFFLFYLLRIIMKNKKIIKKSRPNEARFFSLSFISLFFVYIFYFFAFFFRKTARERRTDLMDQRVALESKIEHEKSNLNPKIMYGGRGKKYIIKISRKIFFVFFFFAFFYSSRRVVSVWFFFFF